MNLTVHMVANAHLDPVWLWPWQQGSDEAIATCRAACDFLDEYPELIFSRGEAWVYDQVRTLDPDLFARIRKHIAAGQWEVVNGWWVQPDCNLPSETGMLRTSQIGQRWFREHLGLPEVPVGYCVDSFGHGAYLPRIMQQTGQRYYVMMRPGPPEMELPSCLFRWRSPDGAEILTFRLMWTYVASTADDGPQGMGIHVRLAVEAAPPGVGHMMCLFGVGDHGGGPSRALIDWIHKHRDYAPGVRLEFSSPSRFFAAVEPFRAQLPVVTGELQMHAVGCYTVCGAHKRDLRAAELAAEDAEELLRRAGADAPPGADAEIRDAWSTICFNHFHDVLGGSAIEESMEASRRELGMARTRAERLTHHFLRRHLRISQSCTLTGQRIHLVNRLSRPWGGLAEVEPWLDWTAWDHHIEDADGRHVPCQRTTAASMVCATPGLSAIPRLLIPVDLPPAGTLSLRIVPGSLTPTLSGVAPALANGRLDNGNVQVEFGPEGISQIHLLGVAQLCEPLRFACLPDSTDTWAHGADRFAGPILSTAVFAAPVLVESGALRTTVRLDGMVGKSACRLFVALQRDEPVVYMRLAIMYREPMTVLKALVAPAAGIRERRDRVAGGWIDRQTDSREYPIHHVMSLGALGLVLPDTFGADCAADTARPTLIRNNYHALNFTPPPKAEDLLEAPNRFGTDEGPQVLRMSIALGHWAVPEELECLLDRAQRLPYAWDDYRGVSRVFRYEGGTK